MRPTSRKRFTDAESELNLPPGFRFHPTDEELIVHYLRRKSQSTSDIITPQPSIIADVDIYKHEPWDLPEMALFGTKEWYFFTPRDRKYPNGSRPNRVTKNGYWKATGADKPIKSKSSKTIGIKKAMVFYAGKGVKGIKTNWIMHEYRLKDSNLDEWVLCRLYNKKNNSNEKIIVPHEHNKPLQKLENSLTTSFDSFGGSFEGDVMLSPQSLTKEEDGSEQSSMRPTMRKEDDDGNTWLDGLSLEDLHHCLEAMPPPNDLYDMPMLYNPNHQLYFCS